MMIRSKSVFSRKRYRLSFGRLSSMVVSTLAWLRIPDQTVFEVGQTYRVTRTRSPTCSVARGCHQRTRGSVAHQRRMPRRSVGEEALSRGLPAFTVWRARLPASYPELAREDGPDRRGSRARGACHWTAFQAMGQ